MKDINEFFSDKCYERKNINDILDEFCKNKYIDTDNIVDESNKNIINRIYGIKTSNYTKTERKFDNLAKVLYHIMIITRKHNLIDCDGIILMQKTVRILGKISECDETSATTCFTCVNEIKDLINRSNLL